MCNSGTANTTKRWHTYRSPEPPLASSPAPVYSSPTKPSIKTHYLNTPVSTLVSASNNIRPAARKHCEVSPPVTAIHAHYREHRAAEQAQRVRFECALKGKSILSAPCLVEWKGANSCVGAVVYSPTELAIQRLSAIWKETAYIIHSTSQSSTWSPSEPPPVETIPRPVTSTALQLPRPLTPANHTFISPQSTPPQPASAFSTAPRRLPLHAFVHEVLRRSKTMWPALQIALCYLDAAKFKVLDAITEAKRGVGLQVAEAELDGLFGSASTNDLGGKRLLCQRQPFILLGVPHPGLKCIEDRSAAPSSIPQVPAVVPADTKLAEPPVHLIQQSPLAPISPLPHRPSPLLCPRRMFIAALILATKFTQDGVYSTRAWAYILGLDVRELGRCERVLGDALDWRLWVGKGIADEPTASMRNLRSFVIGENLFAKSKASRTMHSKIDGKLLASDRQKISSSAQTPPFSLQYSPASYPCTTTSAGLPICARAPRVII